jgi:hypothetical protein
MADSDDADKRPEAQPPTAAVFDALSATKDMLIDRIAMLETQLAAREAEPIPPPPPEPYIRLKDAAGVANVQYNRARIWENRGWLDSCRRGGRLFATASSVIAQRKFRDGR